MSMCPLFNPTCRRREDPPGTPRACRVDGRAVAELLADARLA